MAIPSESRSLSSVPLFLRAQLGLQHVEQQSREDDPSLSMGTSTVVDEGLEKGWFG